MSAKDDRYNRSGKGRARNRRYENTAKAMRRKVLYDTERLDRDYPPYLQEDRLAERERYEASGSTLSFLEWLNKFEPLPLLRMPS